MNLDAMTNSAALQPDVPVEIRLMNLTANALFAIAGVLLAALCLVAIMKLPMFTIHGIRVEGDTTRNNVATIRANATPHLSGTLFTLNLAEARRAFESVPWVRHAVLHRVWPNRLIVDLEEHKPAAFWGDDKLVNLEGEVFEANFADMDDGSVPTLDGPDGSAPQVLAMYRKLEPMFARLDTDLDTLTLSGRGSWHAELHSGAEIELGRGTDAEVVERTERFIGTVTDIIKLYGRQLQYADLRHNQGYAVRLLGITTTQPAPSGKTAKN